MDSQEKLDKPKKKFFSTRKLCFVALFTAMNVALSAVSIPVPGGHLYLNDIVICFASLVFDPISAFIVGGIGAFLGDLFFYPLPMFVSLATHGLQAVVISLIVGKKDKLPKFWRAFLAAMVGAVIMVSGYTLGKIYVYSTKEYAIMKLPFEIAQALIGVVVSLLVLYKSPVKKLFFDIPKK